MVRDAAICCSLGVSKRCKIPGKHAIGSYKSKIYNQKSTWKIYGESPITYRKPTLFFFGHWAGTKIFKIST